MHHNQLTDLMLRKAKHRQREYLLGDGGGVFLRVKPNGAKYWVFIYSADGKRRWKGLGNYPDVGLAEARELASDCRRQLGHGFDPVEAQKAARVEQQSTKTRLAARPTVKALFEDWQRRELSVRRKDGGRVTLQIFVRDVFPIIGERFANEITRRDVLAIISKVAERGARRGANVLRAELKQMFDFALDQEIIQSDPTARVRKLEGGDKIRERILSTDEIRELAEKLPDTNLTPAAQAAIWIMLSTCARVGELSRAKFSDLDVKAGTWTIPAENSKNGREHIIHLSKFTRGQFERIPRAGDSLWVFPGADKNIPILRQSLQKQFKDRQRKKQLKGRSKMNSILLLRGGEWTAHDLRRTGATMMGELGVRPDVIDRCLNHISQSRVTRTYQRQDLIDLRIEAFTKLGKQIESILVSKPGVTLANISSSHGGGRS